MDFLTDLRNKTMQELDLFTTISPMVLPRDNKGIAIRPAPTSNGAWRLDGAQTGVFSVQLLVRADTWLVAWEEINKIDQYWNGQNSDFMNGLTLMQTTTSPNWVEIDDHNRHVFTALYQAEFE
ncbi:minor capsid protein [Salipaludibacillus aurantiacus]|uniref:Bacteriophage minor capsid protein n=1 Tax=Salipaludibacillus aurantiacus TaxID=1601833 RepID=A0A1H9TZ69_9BACI|nr:minor capsid protein [Salipaludibacillus aurantiacus]SES02660.1 bacteriophage minor capsid protein [Salipaludibacillus aurantiacus]